MSPNDEKKCPYCGGDLEEVYIPIENGGIHVDSCKGCGAHLPVE